MTFTELMDAIELVAKAHKRIDAAYGCDAQHNQLNRIGGHLTKIYKEQS